MTDWIINALVSLILMKLKNGLQMFFMICCMLYMHITVFRVLAYLDQ